VKFKVLRAFGSGLGSEEKPLELSREAPKAVHFSNAKGGLRLVDSEEIRELAKASSKRLTAALGTAKVQHSV